MERLQELIEKARTYKMTDQEREAQRRSFAYGNTLIENPRITRQSIDQQAEKMAEANAKGDSKQ